MDVVVLQSGNTWTQVLQADPFILQKMSKEASYPTEAARLLRYGGGDPGVQGGWDGWVRLLRTPKTKPAYFPTGLVPRLTRIVQKFGYQVQWVDERERPLEDFPEFTQDGLAIIDRDYQLEAAEQAVKVGRGVLDMPPRCHAEGDEVLDAQGCIRQAKDIYPGDYLMGVDGPRKVLERHEGMADLYEVNPRWSEPFVVTGNHVLVVEEHRRRGSSNHRRWERVETEVTVSDWLCWSEFRQRKSYLIHVGVNFPEEQHLPIDPYSLGVLLGDASLMRGIELSTSVPEIKKVAYDLAESWDLSVSVRQAKNRVPIYGIVRVDSSRPNPLFQAMRELGIAGCHSRQKFLPEIYKIASRRDRLELLAGLLDTDGHQAGGYFEFSTASPHMAQDIVFLARSLGFSVTTSLKPVNSWTYYRVNIMGAVDEVPLRVRRKAVDTPDRPWRSRGRSSFKIRSMGRGRFVGWTIDGDHRYLTKGFVVTHNSGKTRTMMEIHRRLSLPTIWIAPTDRIVDQTRRVAEGFFGANYVTHLVGSKNESEAALRKLVVCTQNTAANLSPEFYRTREVLVVDEWHHGASKTYSQHIFPKCDHIYFRYGMTGTHFRSGEDDIAMHALLSNVIYKVSSSFLLERGFLVPSRVVFVPVPANPKLRGVGNTFQSGHGKHGIHIHKARNQLVTHCAYYLHRTGRRVLILVGTKAQGYAIQKILEPFLPESGSGCEFRSVEFVSTDVLRPKQGRILESFLDGQEVKVLIGTSLLGEGVDLPTVDALVYARGEKAEVSLVQNAFRVCTTMPGKTDSIIVDFADRHHRKLLKHSHDRLDVYYREPTFSTEVLPSHEHFTRWLGVA